MAYSFKFSVLPPPQDLTGKICVGPLAAVCFHNSVTLMERGSKGSRIEQQRESAHPAPPVMNINEKAHSGQTHRRPSVDFGGDAIKVKLISGLGGGGRVFPPPNASCGRRNVSAGTSSQKNVRYAADSLGRVTSWPPLARSSSQLTARPCHCLSSAGRHSQPGILAWQDLASLEQSGQWYLW